MKEGRKVVVFAKFSSDFVKRPGGEPEDTTKVSLLSK